MKAAEAALKEEKAQVEAEKGRRASARQWIRRRRASCRRSGPVSPKRLRPRPTQQYERVRKGRKGIAVAEVVDGRCTACHMVLRPQYFQDVKRTESILFCESCQRILYYNPPQAFDDLASAPDAVARFPPGRASLPPNLYPTLTPYCGTQLVPN